MFETLRSVSSSLSVDAFISRASRHPAVDGIVLVGSPAADFDLLLFLSNMPVRLTCACATIGGRLADVFFRDTDRLSALVSTAQTGLAAESDDGLLAHWLLTGEIAYDPSGHLAETRQMLLTLPPPLSGSPATLYATWFQINAALAHNRRLFESQAAADLLALDLRLLSIQHELLTGYFRLRGLPWRGEVEAIAYFERHDTTYLNLFRQCLSAPNRMLRMALVEQLAGLALAPVGRLWPPAATALLPEPSAGAQAETIQAALAFWEALAGG